MKVPEGLHEGIQEGVHAGVHAGHRQTGSGSGRRVALVSGVAGLGGMLWAGAAAAANDAVMAALKQKENKDLIEGGGCIVQGAGCRK